MNDYELNSLQKLNVPDPSGDAKQRAMNAAMAAFDDVEKTQKSYQGKFSLLRLITSFLQITGEWIMKRYFIASTAVAVFVVAPVVLFALYSETITLEDAPSERVENSAPLSALQPSTGAKDREKRVILKNAKVATKPIQKKVYSRLKSSAPSTGQGNTSNQPGTSAEISVNRSRSFQASPAAKSDLDDRAGSSVPGLSTGQKPANKQRNYIRVEPVERSNSIHDFAQVNLKKGEQAQPLRKLHTSQEEARPLFEETPAASRDRYQDFKPNPITSVREKPVSTFSIDVDTASYAVMRRALNNGNLPLSQSIRVEELINYFTYNYQLPESAEQPFKANVSVYQTPWNKDTKLLHIGIKGHDIVKANKPRSNLVFLLDVSGSMSSHDKLPLLKSAFRLLVNKLEPEDTVAIVTYAGRSATVLKPTKVKEKRKILEALGNLQSGGSTAGAQGIQQAYKLAKDNFDAEGVNRVILATDGDFNVGITDHNQLKAYIEKQRKSGIFLSVLGFGQGNYNDSLMQVLAQNGNGTAAYIDTLKEAQKVLVDQASSTLFTIAKDVKIQIEFNPTKVAEYRLVGYETRALKREDFNNDKVDAGDIGSGHAVTAIYEITPVGSPAKSVDDLRYTGNKKQQEKKKETAAGSDEYAFLKLRYKLPKESKSKLITIPVTTEQEKAFEALSDDVRFAASVAAFGQKIKGSQYLSDYSWDQIHEIASNARGKDRFGYRSEFLGLVRLAKSLEK